MPVGRSGPKGSRGSPKGGGEEPPQSDDPREEERITRSGGGVQPGLKEATMPGRRRGIAADRKGPGRRWDPTKPYLP